jgi:hypothetical protein
VYLSQGACLWTGNPAVVVVVVVEGGGAEAPETPELQPGALHKSYLKKSYEH